MKGSKVKVLVWGLGAMGKGVVETLNLKKGFEIVGACDIDKEIVGKKLSTLIENYQLDNDPIIEKDIEKILKETNPDVCITSLNSYTKEMFNFLKILLEHKVNCITSAEEMAYPLAKEPELAKELDKIAKENGVSVLGTGINPGMIMDLLVVMFTGVMQSVDHIEVERINSLSPFGKSVIAEQGVGITIEEFEKRKSANKLPGHVGFAESVRMIADALGWKLEKFSQDMKAIITDVDRRSPYGFAAKNHLAGVNMQGYGVVNNEKKIIMKHPQQIEPHLGGVSTGDYIKIKGVPNINMQINPEIDGGVGTYAIIVNMIPHIINAKPGLKTMLDLPVPRAILGDVREMIDDK